MEKIEDYIEQLKQLCDVCKRVNKCKDHNKICAFKKLAWCMAKTRLKRKNRCEKVGCEK